MVVGESGKWSLLEILMCHLINVFPSFALLLLVLQILCYTQDDVVMGTLSVRENLEFSAALRLPGHMTRTQRKERVERVIETLGLYRCADTKVSIQ